MIIRPPRAKCVPPVAAAAAAAAARPTRRSEENKRRSESPPLRVCACLPPALAVAVCARAPRAPPTATWHHRAVAVCARPRGARYNPKDDPGADRRLGPRTFDAPLPRGNAHQSCGSYVFVVRRVPPSSVCATTHVNTARRFDFLGTRVVRQEFEVRNARGLAVRCSQWRPAVAADVPLPTLVYLHGNASCRIEVAKDATRRGEGGHSKHVGGNHCASDGGSLACRRVRSHTRGMEDHFARLRVWSHAREMGGRHAPSRLVTRTRNGGTTRAFASHTCTRDEGGCLLSRREPPPSAPSRLRHGTWTNEAVSKPLQIRLSWHATAGSSPPP